MKGIYLGACRAVHPNYNDIVYQDIDNTRDIGGDMLSIDLSNYDFVICTPPCNYYSHANWRREVSDYSLKTRHLLPCSIVKLAMSGKPFLIENVRNENLFKLNHIFELCDLYGLNVYYHGRHTYFTNLFMDISTIPQILDNIQYSSSLTPKSFGSGKYRQGGLNVYRVVEYFLEIVHERL